MTTSVSASEFSARALELLESVEAGDIVVVHRDGTPIARLGPSESSASEVAPVIEADELTPSDVRSYGLRPKPLTEFPIGNAVMTMTPRSIEVNFAWHADGQGDDI